MPPRKKPFSSKQKKKQLQQKRDKLRNKTQDSDIENEGVSVEKVHEQPAAQHGDKMYDPNRYRLHFFKVSKAEIETRKKQSREIIKQVSQAELEVTLESVNKLGSALDMPKRPLWTYNMAKERVEQNEAKMFQEYVEKIYKEYKPSDLSYFELNLETWRQLWRVIEVSDVIVLITDVRHPVFHFPPALYDYIVKELKKHLILVLNKVDLVPPDLSIAWKHYFLSKFKDLRVVCFTAFPKDDDERIRRQEKVLSRGPTRSRRFSFPVGPQALLAAVQSIFGHQFDFSSWGRKIAQQERGEEEGMLCEVCGSSESEAEEDERCEEMERNETVVTLGFVGHPNVGKSSLMNGLTGRKVVSTSRTPGHTKHFQTIFLTENVRLCDSPGLVFPSLVYKQLQVLSGMYPISQVQEPYTAVGYLAARVPLAHKLNLEREAAQNLWSAWDVCEAWAEKRGYLTAKTGRPDVYRAANSILRLVVEGRIVLCFYPPGYLSSREEWQCHPDTLQMARLQELHCNRGGLSELEGQGAAASASSSEGEGNSDEENPEDGLLSSNPFALLGNE